MKLKVPKELEKIIVANISLLDVNDNIERLRIAKTEIHGIDSIIVSPDNCLGNLGFAFDSRTSNPLYCSTDSPGVIFFDIKNTYILLHSSIKTWPKDLNYNKIDFSDYSISVGQYRQYKENESIQR